MKAEIEITEGFKNPSSKFDFTGERCRFLIQRVLEAGARILPKLPGGPAQAVFVCLTNDSEIRRINKEYRDIDRPTDVLSFPLLNHKEGIGQVNPLDLDPDSGCLLLGDIFLSADRVASQAEEYGHSTERELAFLTCHGYLHLRGFDHMEQQEELRMMETAEKILKEVDLSV